MSTDVLCETCGVVMARMPWNSDTDVLVCENADCTAFRSPVIPAETKIKSANKPSKNPKITWLKGEEDEEDRESQAILLSLQGLREKFHT